MAGTISGMDGKFQLTVNEGEYSANILPGVSDTRSEREE